MSIDAKTQLKPCWFCGNSNLFFHACTYAKTLWTIECPRCGMEFTVKRKLKQNTIGVLLSNHDDVVEMWNGRADND